MTRISVFFEALENSSEPNAPLIDTLKKYQTHINDQIDDCHDAT